ncbi:AraC family transcriptional regulator [Pseudorhodoferax sp. Leaf267]|uniref:AraC family transcriptional regulator n=1 Tax=Pseudorhodoferax sp. Leaf267 TaxID=1736316 RepID=UPI000700D87B|nr:AraC family transcriptional regulator [Pseudorhodoferax sp. Leaf267]KQP14909.1 AraC family transcriptional regulator [Pseudorhodoferax sp. Leaf267]
MTSGASQGQPHAPVRTSSAAWLAGVLAMFAAEGLDVPVLLRDAGLDAAALHRQHARVPVDQITRLWQRAVARVGKPTLGLQRSLAATHSNTGTVGHVMSCSPDLQGALTHLARYMAVISDATAFTLQADARGQWLSTAHTGGTLPIPRQRVEYAMLATLMLCQWLTRAEFDPALVELAYPRPGNDAPHRAAFGCELRFDAPANRMLIASVDLRRTIPTYDAELADMLEARLDKQLAQLGQTSTASRVRAEIARRLQQGEPRREVIARELGLAERTLQRRLQEEHVSYQTLLDDTRHELAQQYLAEERHSLSDVADLLGYGDSSNFHRACKRWFGVPPAQYRARIGA